MTGLAGLVEVEERDDIAWLWLNRPERHNSLNLDLVHAIRDAALDLQDSYFRAVVITGKGRSFSTGGDVAGFLAQASDKDDVRAYASDIVGGLNQAILALCDLPMPLIARVNGAVTGGSAGLMLAAEMKLLSDKAFLQPYYGEVGFAPDGGWTAMLPDLIGPRALTAQYLNHRFLPAEALSLGIVDRVAAPEELDTVIEEWTDQIRRLEPETLATSKRLVRDADWRARLAARLEAERQAFVDLVGRDIVATRMKAFLEAI